jgi:hypothetical protein
LLGIGQKFPKKLMEKYEEIDKEETALSRTSMTAVDLGQFIETNIEMN